MLRIVPHTVPRVGRSHEHFPDGFELHLLRIRDISPAKTKDISVFTTGNGKSTDRVRHRQSAPAPVLSGHTPPSVRTVTGAPRS